VIVKQAGGAACARFGSIRVGECFRLSGDMETFRAFALLPASTPVYMKGRAANSCRTDYWSNAANLMNGELLNFEDGVMVYPVDVTATYKLI
jgi:hypothetical protein